ncbi:hypothetical protein [Chromobacterium piscinae]|uniref:hypothetical protein n=1 Tax=Chromobacterium piscinae TaxID=686831 RepID=UPI003208BB25
MRWQKKLVAIGLLLSLVLAVTYNLHGKNNMITMQDYPSTVEVTIGQQGSSWQAQYGKIVNTNGKNVGLSFYTIDPDSKKTTTTAIINSGTIKTTISNAMSIMATEDRDRHNGFTQIDVSAKINNGGEIPHDTARLYIWNLIQNLKKIGWRHYNYLSDARLKGKFAFDYYKNSSNDPDYALSLQEWMSADAPFTWKFYADHTYLNLKVDRDSTLLDPNKPGAYFISITFMPLEEVERLSVDEPDRNQWRSTWVQRAMQQRSERNVSEAKLRAQGIPIDTDYKDPPLPPAPSGQENPIIPDSLK